MSLSFLTKFVRQRRQPFDERLPDGTPALDVGMPKWQRPDSGPEGNEQRENPVPPMNADPPSSQNAPASGGASAMTRPAKEWLRQMKVADAQGTSAGNADSSQEYGKRLAEIGQATKELKSNLESAQSVPADRKQVALSAVLPQEGQAAPPSQPAPPADRDRSLLPVAERRAAILDGSAPETGSAPVSTPATAPASVASTMAANPRRAQLEAELTKLYGLEDEKVQDKNGRVKSGLLGALRGFLQGVAQTGSLSGGLGGALSGGGIGAWHSDWDEQMKHVAELSKQQGRVDQALKIESELGKLDALDQKMTGGGLGASQLATRRQSFYNFLTKNFPGGYKRGTRKDVDAELDRLQMDAPSAVPKKGGQGRGYVMSPGQMVAFPDGSGGFRYSIPHDEEDNDAPAMSESQIRMDDNQKREIQIRLAELNLRRAHAKLPPITFEDYVAGGGDTPADAPPAEKPAPASAPAPTAAPAGATRPQLVPSGAQPEVVPNRSDGRRRSGDRRRLNNISTGGPLDKYEEGRLSKAENDAAQNRAQAASARSRGEDDVAAAYDDAARVADETANKLRAKQGGRRSTDKTPAPAASAGSQQQGWWGGTSPAPRSAPSGGRVSRSKFVERNPQFKGKSKAEIDAAITSDGYTPVD